MLPAAALFHFPWEIESDLVKDGASIRTFGRYLVVLHETHFMKLLTQFLFQRQSGDLYFTVLTQRLSCMFEPSAPRLTNYLPEESKAILASHHASVQYQVSVQTTFVEPFDPIFGAQYLVLGEIEKSEGNGETIVRARVFNCVDGVEVALLQKAINEQRNFFTERNDEAGARTWQQHISKELGQDQFTIV